MRVLLVWQNDWLLALYFNTPRGWRQAHKRMRKVREADPTGDWARTSMRRWHQRSGSTARLCIEEREVHV